MNWVNDTHVTQCLHSTIDFVHDVMRLALWTNSCNTTKPHSLVTHSLSPISQSADIIHQTPSANHWLFICGTLQMTEQTDKTRHTLTLWRLLLPYGYSYKAPCARPGWAVICNFWHPGTLTLIAERQSVRMSKITNDGLPPSGTGCFIAVPIWQQCASKG